MKYSHLSLLCCCFFFRYILQQNAASVVVLFFNKFASILIRAICPVFYLFFGESVYVWQMSTPFYYLYEIFVHTAMYAKYPFSPKFFMNFFLFQLNTGSHQLFIIIIIIVHFYSIYYMPYQYIRIFSVLKS